ncbi:MAG: cellulase family glycosylhydrolase [Clostridium sp.]|nr:cellulase family glycosylhydrolase [Clostridium sp.]
MDKIFAQGMRFVDEYGRERLLRGINMIDKKPYQGKKISFKYAADDEYLKRCRDCGFNLIRLGALWEVLEPEPGKYNEAFLDELCGILERCEKYGIYVYFDVHQDVWGEYANLGGSGAPSWATLTDGYKVKNTRFVWAEGYYFRKAVWSAFDNFWRNKPVHGKGLQDWYADLFRHLAERFKDKPALLGYEVMNEPVPGKLNGKILLKLIKSVVGAALKDEHFKLGKLLGAVVKKGDPLEQFTAPLISKAGEKCAPLLREFEDKYYTPFVNKIALAVKEVDPERMVVFDQCYWSNFFVPCNVGPVKKSDGSTDGNLCYSPHGYDLMVDTPAYEFADNDRTAGIFEICRKAQERLDLPVIVGEWGGGGEGVNWYPHIDFLLDLWEKYKWSNTYFFYLEDEEELAYRNKQDVGKQDLWDIPLPHTVLNRPFPMAVCGEIEAYHYDTAEHIFTLSYNQAEPSEQATEVFLPSRPQSVELDAGEYKLAEYGNAFCLKLSTGVGHHTLRVQL